jgi:hypothetical protein
MNTIFTKPVVKTIARAMRAMLVDAALGATCAGLYGFVFGGFGALVQDESHRLLWNAGILATFGAAAGLLVGVCTAISEREAISERDARAGDNSVRGSNRPANEMSASIAVRQFAGAGSRPAHPTANAAV